jgi:hypothetical protein
MIKRLMLSLALLASTLMTLSCGGDSGPSGACVRGSGIGATCGDDFTHEQCNMVNGDYWYEAKTCKDLGFSHN